MPTSINTPGPHPKKHACHLSNADGELEGLAPVTAAVKLLAVGQGACTTRATPPHSCESVCAMACAGLYSTTSSRQERPQAEETANHVMVRIGPTCVVHLHLLALLGEGLAISCKRTGTRWRSTWGHAHGRPAGTRNTAHSGSNCGVCAPPHSPGVLVSCAAAVTAAKEAAAVTVSRVRPVLAGRLQPAGTWCRQHAQWTHLGDSHLDGRGVAHEPLVGLQQQTARYEPKAS